MAGETIITVVGNLTADPELRYTQNGLPVANFTIASTPRNFDRAANEWKDGEALFLRASVWREFAEHVAGSLTKGSRVIAHTHESDRLARVLLTQTPAAELEISRGGLEEAFTALISRSDDT